MEKRFAGPRVVTLQGLMSGTLDITMNNWKHQVGLNGERLQYFTEEGSSKVGWKKLNAAGNLGGVNAPLTWYKVIKRIVAVFLHFEFKQGKCATLEQNLASSPETKKTRSNALNESVCLIFRHILMPQRAMVQLPSKWIKWPRG